MPNKIMFVDDQLATDPDFLINIFDCILNSTEKTRLKALDNPMGIGIGDIKKILKDNPCLEVFDSLNDAVDLISRTNDILSEYELFIFDRNLFSSAGATGRKKTYNRSDIEAKTHIRFDENYKEQEGDFLAEYLLSRTKPEDIVKLVARLYFYSAFNIKRKDGEIDTPFAIKVENKNFPKEHFVDKDDNGREQLKKIIRDLELPGKVQIKFKYKKIFGNHEIQSLPSEEMEDFIDLLTRIEYTDGATGFNFKKGDGTLLRNMIAWVVALLSRNNVNTDGISVRGFLNDPKNKYFPHYITAYMLQQWAFYYKKTKPLYPTKEIIPEEDRKKTQEHFHNQQERIEEYFNDISFISELISFHDQLKKLSFDSAAKVPKYIFSYIDNIYTVTSEWAAHGGNPDKVTDLSAEGFRALVYGMCQILDWLADKYPNPVNNQ